MAHPRPPIVALGELLWDMLPSGPRAGGAPFNFAFHCQQLGHPAYIVSRVGADRLGDELRAEVCRLGMSDDFIQTDPTYPTGTVTVAVDGQGQPAYTITPEVAWDFIAQTDNATALITQAVAICYGTLAQRAPTSRATIQTLLANALPGTLRVCDINLRPTSHDPKVWRQAVASCQWLKLNDDEVGPSEHALGIHIGTAAELAPHADLVCLTRGAAGCRLWPRGRAVVDVAGVPVKVVDTVGAGDAFTAALLTQTLEGVPLEQAARFANRYAAEVARHAGGTPFIDRAAVERGA